MLHFFVRFCSQNHLILIQSIQENRQIKPYVHIADLEKLFVGEKTSLPGNISGAEIAKSHALTVEHLEILKFFDGMAYGVSSLRCGLSIFPSCWLMEGSGGSLFLIALAIIIPISVFYAGVFGPEAALFSDLFPPDVRYTGISIVYQFPGILVAGIVPGLCTFLINWNEGDPLYVCLFTLLAAVTSALSAFAIQRKSIAAQRKHGDDAEHI